MSVKVKAHLCQLKSNASVIANSVGYKKHWINEESRLSTSTAAATSTLSLQRASPSRIAVTISEIYFSRLSFLMSFSSWAETSAVRPVLHFLMKAVFFLMLESRFLRAEGSRDHRGGRSVVCMQGIAMSIGLRGEWEILWVTRLLEPCPKVGLS